MVLGQGACHPELTFFRDELYEAILPLVTPRVYINRDRPRPRKETYGWLADGGS